uniref:Putative leucine-rich repeat protein (LRRP) n=1 Tax=Trypanosoma congolense (strain IL3000) TaxID=1068625 RepID=G0UVJ3_TRYCI|nr:putative leucine-rich repeat protein (LRRP) [Trypanosoma congolense IL3000]
MCMRRIFKWPRGEGALRRWRWTPLSGPSCLTFDMLAAATRHEGMGEVEWDLDFSFLPELQACYRTDAMDGALCRSCDLLSESAGHVERLWLTVSCPRAVEACVRFLRGARPVALRSLDLVLRNTAFTRDERALSTLLRSATGVAVRLESVRVAMISDGAHPAVGWCRQMCVPAALASLISAPALRSLALEHLSVSSASEEDLLVLGEAMARSCTNLMRLSLCGSVPFFSRIPSFYSALACMSKLEVLDLSGACLEDVQLKRLIVTLRSSIGGWHHLEQLNLAGCGVSEWVLRLLYSDLCDAQLLPTGASAGLQVLNLSSNGIDDDCAFILASICLRCRSLCELHLRHNRIAAKGAGAIGSALVEACELRVLNLHSNPLRDEGLREVLRAAGCWRKLQRVDLTRCRLTARCLPVLCAAAPFMREVQEVVLDRNDLRPVGAGSSCDGVLGGELQLSVYDSAYRGAAAGDAKALTSFELDRRDAVEGRCRYKGDIAADEAGEDAQCSAGDAAFESFGAALCGCRELCTLSLSGCSLPDSAFVPFAGAFVSCRLRRLDLSANPLFCSVGSVEALGLLLRRGAGSLEVLDLSCTGLGSVGISVLADGTLSSTGEAAGGCALCLLCALKELRLSHCRIEEDGFYALADVIPSMCALERVFLDGNRVHGPAAVVSLLGKAASLPSIAFIGLHGTVLPCDRAEVTSCREYCVLTGRGVTVHI